MIDSLSRRGLNTQDTLHMFYLAEEEFRKTTEISRLHISSEEITQKLLENRDIISIFKTVTDDVTDVTNETRENVLNKILHLYFRVRSYSLASEQQQQNRKKSTKMQRSKKV